MKRRMSSLKKNVTEKFIFHVVCLESRAEIPSVWPLFPPCPVLRYSGIATHVQIAMSPGNENDK